MVYMVAAWEGVLIMVRIMIIRFKLWFWVEMWRLPLLWSWNVDPFFLPTLPGLPNNWYRSLLGLVREWEWILVLSPCIESLPGGVVRMCVPLVIPQCKYRMWELTLVREIVRFKCKWLSPTSTMNGLNVGYKREVTHRANALRFWMEMWCLHLLWVKLPNTIKQIMFKIQK